MMLRFGRFVPVGIGPPTVDPLCAPVCEPTVVATVVDGVVFAPFEPAVPTSPVGRGRPFTKRGAVFDAGDVAVFAPPAIPLVAMPFVGAAVCGFGLNATSPFPVPDGVLVAPLNGGCVRCAPATVGVPSGAGVGVVFGAVTAFVGEDVDEATGAPATPLDAGLVAPLDAGTSVSVGGPAGAGDCVACVDDATSFVALDLLEVVDGAVAR